MVLDELEAPAQWACAERSTLGMGLSPWAEFPPEKHNAALPRQHIHWQPLELDSAGSGGFRTFTDLGLAQ